MLQSVTSAHQEQTITLLQEMEDIIHEKGFRFSASLNTPREHQEIGSSGYGGIYWDTDPDIPVSLLRQRIIASKGFDPEESVAQKDTMTIEEIDRARRLLGMTSLDLKTGRVTEHVAEEAANDSYHFLTPERRAEVVLRESQLVEEIGIIAAATIETYEASLSLLNDLAAYIDGDLTTPQMEERYETVLTRMSERHPLDLNTHLEEAKRLSFELGNRDYLLTPQEILLRVGGKVDHRYLDHPYTPLAVQDGVVVEQIASLRRGEQSMVVNSHILEYKSPFGFRLEELDEKGNTTKSPTLLDRNGISPIGENERFQKEFGPRIDFPFPRPEDWFYHEL